MDENKFNTSTSTDVGSTGAKHESLKDKLGDALEKVGHKISEAGAPGLGQKIHDLGDKIETDHSNPNHPHKA